MRLRRLAATVTAILAAAGLGCSKTQDTSPESRIFGSPPSITSVDVTLDPSSSAVCDVTNIMRFFWCNPTGILGLPADVVITFEGPILITATYNRIRFSVQVSDPDSQGTSSDILLTSASFVKTSGQDEETTLVLLDDGGTNKFDFSQVSQTAEACQIDVATNTCGCGLKTYPISSNDAMAGDGLYTRTFAFILPGGTFPAGPGNGFAEDCVLSKNEEAPVLGGELAGAPIPFTIEAVDRSGNLAVWPVKPEVTIGTSTYACSGDTCSCCILQTNDPSICRGLPGTYSSYFPNGLCVDLL